MKRYIYIDESGYMGDYIFAAVCVNNTIVPHQIINNWRKWMKRRVKNFNQNEYHDYKATAIERAKILKDIAIHKDDISFWSVLKHGYDGKHKEFYTTSIATLLRLGKITEKDTVITVDRVEKRRNTMDKYMRQIKKTLEMPGLDISYVDSEKEKGIQIADAIAGSISRECTSRTTDSLYKIIRNQAIAETITI